LIDLPYFAIKSQQEQTVKNNFMATNSSVEIR